MYARCLPAAYRKDSSATPTHRTLDRVSHRFAALGDSFTEGVGDWDSGYPNGVRGWADRVAKQLGKADPDTQYLNLALRSRGLEEIVATQLPRAIAWQPTVVSFFAGGNDLLLLRTDVAGVLDRYEHAVAQLAATGARLLLFTSYDVRLSPLLEPLRGRNDRFNRRIRQVAHDHGAILIDHWAMREFRSPRMWEPDRLHMSRHGHRHLAAAVLRALQVEHSIRPRDLDGDHPMTRTLALQAELEWWRDWVWPMLGRRRRGEPAGHDLSAKWPVPIRPADGMRRLAAAQERGRVPDPPTGSDQRSAAASGQ